MGSEAKKIVVMGGSFNPPTLAHYRLMTEAVAALGAELGFFVPVSDAYLRRKMRHSQPPVVLSPEMRVSMLRAMCAGDSRLKVCEKEIGTIEPRTMPTLMELQEDYPDAELYFVMGADKLGLLVSLTQKRAFLDAFNVVLYSRENDNLEESLNNIEVLSGYRDRIVILPQPEGIAGVSSSLVRERMLRGEASSDLLCSGAWELFRGYTSKDFPYSINRFTGEYGFLANRHPCRIALEGRVYGSAEAAFQAIKSSSENDGAQLEAMAAVLRAKFEQNPSLMQKLADTGNSLLVNGNSKHETFWGIDLYSWIGENHLGKLLMTIRQDTQK